jgi:hypothetical protein
MDDQRLGIHLAYASFNREVGCHCVALDGSRAIPDNETAFRSRLTGNRLVAYC